MVKVAVHSCAPPAQTSEGPTPVPPVPRRQVMTGRKPYVRADDGSLAPNKMFLQLGPDAAGVESVLPGIRPLVKEWVRHVCACKVA